MTTLSTFSEREISDSFFKLIGNIRQSINEIPKEYYTRTLANLVELQQDDLAFRLAKIVVEQKGIDLLEEWKSENHIQLIELTWALNQLGLLEQLDMSFLTQVNLNKIDPQNF